MNITHFVDNLNRGGLERMVIDLIEAQLAQGHGCQVVCLFERGALAHELDAWGVPVFACGKRKGIDIRALRSARRWIRQHGTEVLHTHNLVSHYQAVLASLGLPLTRVINTRHGMGARYAGSRREWLYRRVLPFTDIVATVCETVRRDAIERGIAPPAKLIAVANGIRLNALEPATPAAHERLSVQLGLPTRTRLLGCVARLSWAKDLGCLIRAYKMLRERMPASALLLIGDGPLRQELQDVASAEGVAEHVMFLGERNDVPDLLAGLDLFALSSITEGYSMGLLEACAAALPIVATNVGGNREIVCDGVNGWIVPPRDPAALANAMHDMLADLDRARAMGNRGRSWVVEHGSLAHMAAQYDALYRTGRLAAPA